MTTHVTGDFVIDDWAAQDPYDTHGDMAIGHVTLRKTFRGALTGTSEVHMIGAQNPGAGTGAYVAIERFHGDLDGRAGSFVLQHHATATADGQTATVTVVPGSGTGELASVSGELTIIRDEDGGHRYELAYDL